MEGKIDLVSCNAVADLEVPGVGIAGQGQDVDALTTGSADQI